MVVVVVIFVVVAWLVAGAIAYSVVSRRVATAAMSTDPCASCRRLDAWWASLGWFGKLLAWWWYLVQKTICRMRGC
jgi:hypothetical protein